jgi:hypothetical protein
MNLSTISGQDERVEKKFSFILPLSGSFHPSLHLCIYTFPTNILKLLPNKQQLGPKYIHQIAAANIILGTINKSWKNIVIISQLNECVSLWPLLAYCLRG